MALSTSPRQLLTECTDGAGSCECRVDDLVLSRSAITYDLEGAVPTELGAVVGRSYLGGDDLSSYPDADSKEMYWRLTSSRRVWMPKGREPYSVLERMMPGLMERSLGCHPVHVEKIGYKKPGGNVAAEKVTELRGQKRGIYVEGDFVDTQSVEGLADAVEKAFQRRKLERTHSANSFHSHSRPRFSSRQQQQHGGGGFFERYKNIHAQPEMKKAPRSSRYAGRRHHRNNNNHHPAAAAVNQNNGRRQQPSSDDDDDDDDGPRDGGEVAEDEFFDDVDVDDHVEDEEYENSDDEFFKESVPFDLGAVHVQYFFPLVKLAIADDAPMGSTPPYITSVILGAQLDLLVSQDKPSHPLTLYDLVFGAPPKFTAKINQLGGPNLAIGRFNGFPLNDVLAYVHHRWSRSPKLANPEQWTVLAVNVNSNR